MIRRYLVQFAIGLVRLYQRCISPYLGANCRYHPTCSEYAMTALQQRGLLVGSYLAVRRLLRCHPFTAGGYDPVPPAFTGEQRDA